MTKTILVSCYTVNPYKGSEDGMGWNFVNQIARFNKVIAITRENNKPHIEKFMSENKSDDYQNITFLYFDLPYWMRFWKKGSRGAMLYYVLWQKMIVGFIKSQKIEFDIVHNLNFHNDWTPSYLWKLQKPFVWGPIGHHPTIPTECLNQYPMKYKFKEIGTWIVKNIFWKLSFSLKRTIKKADTIIGMNSEVIEKLTFPKQKLQIMPSVASEDFGYEITDLPNKFNIISVGRFVPLKGFDLTIKSFLVFLSNLSESEKQNCKLTLIGTGPEKTKYEKLIAQHNANNFIEIIEWTDRKKLMEIYKSASLFLFPSHEGAGMVVSEALSFGLPVICLDNSGPGEFINKDCGFKIKFTNYDSTVNELAKSIQNLYEDKNLFLKMRQNARQHFLTHFEWNNRGNQLQKIYQNLS